MSSNPSTESRAPSERVVLYFSAPVSGALAMLRSVLRGAGIAPEEPFPELLILHLERSQLDSLAELLSTRLHDAELAATRCCLLPDGKKASPVQLMQAHSVSALLAKLGGRWLEEMLRADRLVTYFQPIVRCRSPGEVFAYECLSRGNQADGSLIPPDRLYKTARLAGLLSRLDHCARLTAIRTAAQHRLTTRVFINFNPGSIDDPALCLQDVIRAIGESGIAPDRFVFEVVESDEINDLNRLLRILDVYREAGFGVALDDLGAGYSSLNVLAELKPDYIKLDMRLLRDVDRDPYKAQVAAKLLELARELGVATVVEGVETASQWQWANSHGADYAQGYLFAHPAALPPPSRFRGAGPPAAEFNPAAWLPVETAAP